MEIEIEVIYDKEMQEVSIRDYHYNSCTYCNIKSKEEVGKCVNDFIKSYYEEEEDK